MKHLLISSSILAATICLVAPATSVAREAGDWLARGRIINVSPNDDSSVVTGIASSAVAVDSATSIELDFTYFVTDDWALELILATTKHDISGAASINNLGTLVEVGVLPPTLTLQYHFDFSHTVHPYVGAGVNYTVFYDEEGKGTFAGADIDLDNSFGFAAQAGVDFELANGWLLNVDAKYITIDTTANIRPDATQLLQVDADIDPWVFGIGLGYEF